MVWEVCIPTAVNDDDDYAFSFFGYGLGGRDIMMWRAFIHFALISVSYIVNDLLFIYVYVKEPERER